MLIYIQKIQTNWTKRSRGFPNASFRNKVPEKLPIEMEITSDAVLLQETVFAEGCFDEPIRKGIQELNETQLREQRLEFEKQNEELEIHFWNEDKIKKKVGILPINSWCQIKTNRRFPMEYTWGYYKIVYNIFLVIQVRLWM
ncbi:hypothetical protein [Flammeovirga aprica]|uniref:Uncharacterized protein n=1 Tax=Flammeovirga aprica JL-4 TaxID=694437 RepID=A0A7X9S0W1_9BACT|nr:hypothetical protein [Flammeovirga aprica]NME72289.1 hypothetical protein [Flammeovirga aprica JL-4]